MIHKIIKGSYFKGALRYVLDPNKGLLIGGTFGSHQSPSEIAHEMREVAGDRLRKPVFHAVLRFPMDVTVERTLFLLDLDTLEVTICTWQGKEVNSFIQVVDLT